MAHPMGEREFGGLRLDFDRRLMVGLFRQSTFGRLGGYEDVDDTNRLGHDPAMLWIGGHAIAKQAASASQIGRVETGFLAADGPVRAGGRVMVPPIRPFGYHWGRWWEPSGNVGSNIVGRHRGIRRTQGPLPLRSCGAASVGPTDLHHLLPL